jgi:DNA-binding FadR family transcriptional regulator
VVEQIADAIRAGDVRVGERLPAERSLAAQLEVSRPTLREALRLLSEAGVVEVLPGPRGGTFVRSDVVPPDLLGAPPRLRLGEVADVLQARRLFEPHVAQLAALYASAEDFDAMRWTIEQQRRHSRDRARFLQLDHRFHLALARATRNSIVVSLMRQLLRHLSVAQEMAIRRPHEPDWAIAIHERTLQAIMGGDSAAIDAAMDEHLAFLEQIWAEETGREPLRRVPVFRPARGDGGPT